MKHLTSTDPVSASWAGLRLALNREGIYYLLSTIYYLHFLQNSAESPACRLPTAHPSPILSPISISLNISLLYILIFSAVATKRKLNELKPIKYKGPQLCLWDEGVCGLLQLPHEKIVIVTSPDAAVCRAAAVLQSPRGCSAAPRPRCSCGGWSRSTSACSGSWTAVDAGSSQCAGGGQGSHS